MPRGRGGLVRRLGGGVVEGLEEEFPMTCPQIVAAVRKRLVFTQLSSFEF
jgi:hypothetical protein